MYAKTQYKLSASDLEIIITIVRAGTLAAAGERLGVDASTIFRSVQRIERGLEQSLFVRSRTGYRPTELSLTLAAHAEQMLAQVELAQSAVQQQPEKLTGTIKITTTDSILHGLVAPALKTLQATHPLLVYELHTGNELISLTNREADIAIRATKNPPEHLVGKHVGRIKVALFASKHGLVQSLKDVKDGKARWIAPDSALPEHPSVLWRKKHFPDASPDFRVSSILTVMEFITLGMGVGLLPIFLARTRPELIQLTDVIEDDQTDLWLLVHPESKHVKRIFTVFKHLSVELLL